MRDIRYKLSEIYFMQYIGKANSYKSTQPQRLWRCAQNDSMLSGLWASRVIFSQTYPQIVLPVHRCIPSQLQWWIFLLAVGGQVEIQCLPTCSWFWLRIYRPNQFQVHFGISQIWCGSFSAWLAIFDDLWQVPGLDWNSRKVWNLANCCSWW